jgi:hypothetical protein
MRISPPPWSTRRALPLQFTLASMTGEICSALLSIMVTNAKQLMPKADR